MLRLLLLLLLLSITSTTTTTTYADITLNSRSNNLGPYDASSSSIGGGGGSGGVLSWIPLLLLTLLILLPLVVLLLRVALAMFARFNSLGGGSQALGRILRAVVGDKVIVPPKVSGTHFPYGVVEFKGPRGYMEDRQLVVARLKDNAKASLFGVFDGHGGEFASQFCVDNFAQNVVHSPKDPFTDPEGCLTYAFRATDEQLLNAAAQKGTNAGTTAVVLLVNANKITVANAGDSRAILVNQNGITRALSVDHKPDRKDERTRITNLGGVIVHWGVWRVEGLLAVSRGLGDSLLKKFVIPDPEFSRHDVTSSDLFVVIATDGLWDVIRNEEVGRMMMSCVNPQAGAEMLCQEAIKRGTMDNVTVLVVDLQSRSGPTQGSGLPNATSSSSLL